ncbi:hypothetical protein HELRODRAFT_70726, partial [Helobdella robusta]|uniref:Small ribosomal subunit protein mS40 n=1 Tax=Helobdella robusta TaxID=6412 RepID=T1G0B2_HELRO
STKSEGVTNEETTTDKPSRPLVDVETSKRYLKSDSYNKTYLGSLVWQPYRRNHRGHLPPRKIRRSCYIGGKLATGNPCPICRDQYLVLHPENVDLLKQFVSPYTGKVLSNHVTNLCQIQHKKLLVSIEQAWDSGNLAKAVPFKEYNYEDYYPELRKKKSFES